MLKKIRIDGTLQCDIAHIKISRIRDGNFDLHILLKRGNFKVEKILCKSFPVKHKDTIESDCIAELLNNIPKAIRIKTEVYFKGELVLTLSPAR